MACLTLLAILSSAFLQSVRGHGAVTKPSPRMAPGKAYCAWCVGEGVAANSGTGVHRDARLSSPCMGSQPGDAPYPPNNWAGYKSIAGDGTVQTFTKGDSFEATIVLDADHNGEAVWQFCPHSEAQTEECFFNNMLVDWTDVHSYWDPSIAVEHLRSKDHYPQNVPLPASMPSGPVTLRWLWVCKNTNEIFTSCIDANIIGTGSTQPMTPAPPAPEATPLPADPQPDPEPEPEPEPEAEPEPEPEAEAEPEAELEPEPEPETEPETPSPTASPTQSSTTPSCAAHCRTSNAAVSWTKKCSWSNCKGCSDCAAILGSCPNGLWSTCGGKDWTGATCCQTGSFCKFQNAWYSQCIEESSLLQGQGRRGLKIQRHRHTEHMFIELTPGGGTR